MNDRLAFLAVAGAIAAPAHAVSLSPDGQGQASSIPTTR